MAAEVLFLCPAQRYQYWSPVGMRPGANPRAHANIHLGTRSSPFPSVWHVRLAPAVRAADVIRWWMAAHPGGAAGDGAWLFGDMDALRAAAMGGVQY